MLFIVVHQAYELWFKQILHELALVDAIFAEESLDDRDIGRAVAALERIERILKLLIDQLDVLETMTPLDVLEFRDLLFPSSGFPALQFRPMATGIDLRRGDSLRSAETGRRSGREKGGA